MKHYILYFLNYIESKVGPIEEHIGPIMMIAGITTLLYLWASNL